MTRDLTKITTPFGLLDEETQRALLAHGGPYEFYSSSGWSRVSPVWSKAATYRVAELPKTKPSIDWSHVAPLYGWLAADAYGAAWLYRERPHRGPVAWRGVVPSIRAEGFVSFVPGTCDWKDSLVCRPGIEDNE